MRIISKARLRLFWENPNQADAKGSLCAWYTHVNHKSVVWHSWGDLKADYPAASIVGSCVVFNIGGNKYRLVTRILYPSQKVLILKVMTHREYDDSKWIKQCGCYTLPPVRSRKGKPRRP